MVKQALMLGVQMKNSWNMIQNHGSLKLELRKAGQYEKLTTPKNWTKVEAT